MTAARLPATPTVIGSNVPTKPMTVDLADSDRERRQGEHHEGQRPAILEKAAQLLAERSADITALMAEELHLRLIYTFPPGITAPSLER